MTTFDRTNNQSAASLNTAASSYGRSDICAETVIDFSATGNAHAAADVFKLIQVPRGYTLEETGFEVLIGDTAGNSGTLQLGLGGSTRGSAVATTSAGFAASAYNATAAAPTGSDAYVQGTIATGAVNSVVRIWARMSDSRGKPGTPVCIGAGAGNYASPASYTLTEVA